ncbi:MAG: hypothetical protein CVT60_01600 [Actinobacteria bacterium HGW-Actinobacteria-10]|jgi:polyhydroxyalkanoate synthesis regulator phasin|nr:MAG: hypothetical protein CVT60_01600 [Actinobacteria bacterium HGW-Actinobacteria-10]
MADNDMPGGTRNDVGLIEKAFLMGIGVAMTAKDKAEELADELVARGQMTKDESDSFVGRVAVKADEASAQARTTVAEETGKVVASMGLASKKDLERVEAELTEIKALIASLRPTSTES